MWSQEICPHMEMKIYLNEFIFMPQQWEKLKIKQSLFMKQEEKSRPKKWKGR